MLKTKDRFVAPTIDFFINKLTAQIPFQFCKLNHAFWDTALTVAKYPNTPPKAGPAWSPRGWLYLHGVDLMRELMIIIQDLPNTNIILAASNSAAAGVVVRNRNGDREIQDFIIDSFPANYQLLYGPLLKEYAVQGTLGSMIHQIAANNDVLVVGLPHTAKLQTQFPFRKFQFYELELYSTTQNRVPILEELKNVIGTLNSPVVLFQAGESLSLWFVYHLQKIHPHVTMIDMGRTIDCWCPNETPYNVLPDITNQVWKRHREGSIL